MKRKGKTRTYCYYAQNLINKISPLVCSHNLSARKNINNLQKQEKKVLLFFHPHPLVFAFLRF